MDPFVPQASLPNDDQSAAGAQPPPSKPPCKKGCCGKKNVDAAAASAPTEQPPQQETSPSSSDQSPLTPPPLLPQHEISLSEQVSPSSSSKPPCKKGCCGKKSAPIENAAAEEQQQELKQQADQPPASSSCKKGCCKKKPEESAPESQHPVPPPPSEKQLADFTLDKPACKKGCCGSKKSSDSQSPTADPVPNLLLQESVLPDLPASPSSPTETETDKAKPSCKKGCCGSAKKAPPEIAALPPSTNGCPKTCCQNLSPIPETTSTTGLTTRCPQPCCASTRVSSASTLSPMLPQTDGHTAVSMTSETSIYTADLVRLVVYNVSGMTCADCASLIDMQVTKLPGVQCFNVAVMTSEATVQLDPRTDPTTVEHCITTLGFGVTVKSSKTCKKDEVEQSERPSVSLYLRITFTPTRGDRESLQHAAEQLNGVKGVRWVDQGPGYLVMEITYFPDQVGARTVRSAVRELPGVGSADAVHKPATEVHSITQQWRDRFIIGLILTLPIFLFVFVIPEDAGQLNDQVIGHLTLATLIQLLLATPVQIIVAWPLYPSAFKAAWYGRALNIDALIVISTTLAYSYSFIIVVAAIAKTRIAESTFFDTSTMVLTLIALGRYLECLAKGRASDSVHALAQLQPESALLVAVPAVEDACGSESSSKGPSSCCSPQPTDQYPVDAIPNFLIERRDILKIVPGMRIATDGVVMMGSSAVDESMITGESRSVTKQVGSVVYGGTVNLDGVLFVSVTAVPGENLIADIVTLVQQAQAGKPPIQHIADRVALVFVPVIVLTAVLVFVIWLSVAATDHVSTGGETPFAFALQFALATLVISCPCAVGLAVPTAIVVASGVGARLGVLFKSGGALEASHKVDTVVFDKTGTLTSKVIVTSWNIVNPSWDPARFWRLVAAAESHSEHAVAAAIVDYAKSQLGSDFTPPTAAEFQASPGRGVSCLVDGSQRVLVGNFDLMTENQVHLHTSSVALRTQFAEIADSAPEDANIVLVAVDGVLVGSITLDSDVKREAEAVIKKLLRSHVDVWILSGDTPRAVAHVAQQLNVTSDHAIGGLLPAQKAEIVTRLRTENHTVAMVGDGINDSPALAAANVGMAVHRSTNLAAESADVVLLKDDLMLVVAALELAHATYYRIKFNFAWAFMYNLIAVPFAAGFFYPGLHVAIPSAFAGLSELLSSLPVVLSSLWLRRFIPSFLRDDLRHSGVNSSRFVNVARGIKRRFASQPYTMIGNGLIVEE